MDALITQLEALARRMWRYRWHGLAAAWLAATVGAVVTILIPNRYEASARIHVDTQSILKPLMSGLTVQPNVELQVIMLSRTLITRPHVEKLIRMADLDLRSPTKAEQDALVDRLMRDLSIKSTGRDNLYTLSYVHSDPNTARRVVQALASIFIESSVGATRRDTATATSFINEQIKQYEAKLEEAESRLKQFRLENIEMTTGDGKDAAGRLGELSQQLERARLELREAENARAAAKAQIDSLRKAGTADQSTLGILIENNANVATPEIDGRIDAQKRNLDALLQRFTDAHPDVISTRKLLKDLEEQKQREVKELRRAAQAAPMGSPGGSLVSQELVRALSTSEVQVATMRARVEEYSRRYAQAMESMKLAPAIEAKAAQLNRDYAVHKKNYDDLVARRESAAISGDLDVASGVADFRVIDPPRANPKPVAPNRLLLLVGVLVLSLLSGLFVSFAASQLRPIFQDPMDLALKTQLPILGVVNYLATAEDRRLERRDTLRFWLGSGGLVLVFILGLIFMAMWSKKVVAG